MRQSIHQKFDSLERLLDLRQGSPSYKSPTERKMIRNLRREAKTKRDHTKAVIHSLDLATEQGDTVSWPVLFRLSEGSIDTLKKSVEAMQPKPNRDTTNKAESGRR